MKIILIALCALATIASGQNIITNTSVIASKTIAASDLTNIVAGVNAMNLAPVSVTPESLRSAFVQPAGASYRISVAVQPSLTTTTSPVSAQPTIFACTSRCNTMLLPKTGLR